MPANFQYQALTPSFGARVDSQAQVLDEAALAALRAAFVEHQLLVLRGRRISPAEQVRIGSHFGEVQVHVMDQYHADGHPELYRLTNVDAQGRPNGRHPDRGTMAWHTDGSWRQRTGQATIMYAEVVPARGGETWFCDMYGAHERLSASWKQRLVGLQAVHNLDFSRTRRHGEDPMTEAQRDAVPPVAHPIVRKHPETARPAVFLGDHAEYVQGMDYDAGRALIEELNALLVSWPELIYQHAWQPDDLVIWDNRCLLHRATGYDVANEPRVMRRCTVLGEVPVA